MVSNGGRRGGGGEGGGLACQFLNKQRNLVLSSFDTGLGISHEAFVPRNLRFCVFKGLSCDKQYDVLDALLKLFSQG